MPIWGWTSLGVGLAGSALIGVARVAAGSHFPTDVLVGAAAGAAIGIAIPALHDAGVSVSPVVDTDSESASIVVGYRL
jgi:membrane-associated phospholipid phosphatase